MLPSHLAYCTQNGSPIPYRARSASSWAGSMLSPCASSAATWVVRKSPGGSWMMKNAIIVTTISVGTTCSTRCTTNLSTSAPSGRSGARLSHDQSGRGPDSLGPRPNSSALGEEDLLRLGDPLPALVVGQLRLVVTHVVQIAGHDHRGERQRDQADGVDLLLVLAGDRLPGGDPVLVGLRGAQVVPVVHQVLDLLRWLHPLGAGAGVPPAVPGRNVGVAGGGDEPHRFEVEVVGGDRGAVDVEVVRPAQLAVQATVHRPQVQLHTDVRPAALHNAVGVRRRDARR